MLYYQTVESHTLELLRVLTKEPLLKDTRLVGGTSLALQYGHRNSVDLDFFGHVSCEEGEMTDVLRKYGLLQIVKESENIKIYILDGIKIDLINYRYPWIDNPVLEDDLNLASPIDIAAMKINAIEGRGTKKDFIDVSELLKHYTLEEMLSFYGQKYPGTSEFRALMSLSYFEDAELQPMPKMFIEDDWQIVKDKVSKAVIEYKNNR